MVLVFFYYENKWIGKKLLNHCHRIFFHGNLCHTDPTHREDFKHTGKKGVLRGCMLPLPIDWTKLISWLYVLFDCIRSCCCGELAAVIENSNTLKIQILLVRVLNVCVILFLIWYFLILHFYSESFLHVFIISLNKFYREFPVGVWSHCNINFLAYSLATVHYCRDHLAMTIAVQQSLLLTGQPSWLGDNSWTHLLQMRRTSRRGRVIDSHAECRLSLTISDGI